MPPAGPALRVDPVRVRAPATSANLGPGFDCFGLALGLYDEVEVGTGGAGVRVAVRGEGEATVSRGEKNLVARAARAGFAALGVAPAGLELECVNRIPHGRGLGSSAAAICAGLVAARACVSDGADRLDDEALFALAAELEGHPDNVAACLRGGLTLAWTGGDGPRALRLDPVPGLVAAVFVPAAAMSTATARGLLPDRVPHADAVANAARAALLVEALTRRPELLVEATEDWLHQPYRASAMPDSAALVERLRGAGVAAVVSGAGPTVLALATGDLVTGEASADLVGELARQGIDGWNALILPIDGHGCQVMR